MVSVAQQGHVLRIHLVYLFDIGAGVCYTLDLGALFDVGGRVSDDDRLIVGVFCPVKDVVRVGVVGLDDKLVGLQLGSLVFHHSAP